MKIPQIQHLIASVFLSFIIAGSFISINIRKILPSSPSGTAISGFLIWFFAFGLTGFLWMIFERTIPSTSFTSWLSRLMRGIFVWGPILSFLIWYLPIIFHSYYSGFEYEFIFYTILGFVLGFILSLILSIYSYFFVKFN